MSFSTVTSQGASPTAIAMAIWSYSPRSLTDIQSLVNAIQNNNPNLLSILSELSFIPAPMYSGLVSLTQVASFISNFVQNYNADGLIASFINSNPYSLWNINFVVNLIQNPYLGSTNSSIILSITSTSVLSNIAINANMSATSLLQYLQNSALVGTAAQAMLYSLAQNYYYNKWIQTITAGYGSTTISTNVTITTSPIFAQNLTISSGVTVTCGLHTCYFVAQQFNNYGTIVNQNGASGGGGFFYGGGNGGIGGGGIVVLALTSALGTIIVNGSNGSNGGSTTVWGNGNPGAAGSIYILSTNAALGGGGGGSGGGGAPNGAAASGSYVGGNGGNITLYTSSNGNSMLTYIMQGISDWWTINVLGKSLSSTTPLPIIYNAGGGGGGVNSSYNGGGGGGGGGGEVISYAYNIISGNISANGGIGGTGYSSAGNGGGGGGGYIYVFYGSTSGSLKLSALGGSGNASGGAGIATTIQVTVNG